MKSCQVIGFLSHVSVDWLQRQCLGQADWEMLEGKTAASEVCWTPVSCVDASNTNIASLHQFCSNSCSKAFSKTLCHTDSSPYGEHPKSFPKLESPFLIRSANHVLSRHVPSLLDLFTPKPLFGTFFVPSFLGLFGSDQSDLDWSFGHENPWNPRILVPKKPRSPGGPSSGSRLGRSGGRNWCLFLGLKFRWTYGEGEKLWPLSGGFSVLAPQVLPSFEAFLQNTQLEVRRYLGPKICGSRGSPKRVHCETAAAWWKVRMAAIKTAGDPSQRQVVAESPGRLGWLEHVLVALNQGVSFNFQTHGMSFFSYLPLTSRKYHHQSQSAWWMQLRWQVSCRQRRGQSSPWLQGSRFQPWFQTWQFPLKHAIGSIGPLNFIESSHI